MSTLTTLTVRVLNSRGKDMFQNPRFLRVITGGSEHGKFAVARHGKALVVTGIAAPDAVTVDSTAMRVDLAITRAAKLTDIGMTPKAKPTAAPSLPSDTPILVAKYRKAIDKSGAVWIENALTHTKDPVKREAMEIALGRKLPSSRVSPVKGKKFKSGEERTVMEAAAKAKPAVDVNALARAIQDGGAEAGVAYLKGIATDAE